MVSSLIIDSLQNSVGRKVIAFLENGWRNEGKILGCDDEFLKIYEFKKCREKFLRLRDIVEVEIS